MRYILLICLFTVSYTLISQSNTNQKILINGADVWDGASDELLEGYSVLIEGNMIVEVGQQLDESTVDQIIDASGRTLIPGLSDAHVHLSFTMPTKEARNEAHWMYISIKAAKAAENFLMLGFTTVRDLGGPVFGLKRAIDEGLTPGPRIYPSGAFISQTSGHGDLRNPNEPHPYFSDMAHPMEGLGYAFIVDGKAEVLKASRENLKTGATQLKVMAGGGVASIFDPVHSIQFTAEELEAAVQAAADWDTYVTVHAYTPAAITRALEAGVRCIDHGHLIDEPAMKLLKEKDAWLVPQSYWNLLPMPTPDQMAPERIKKMAMVNAGVINEMELAKKYQVNLGYGTDAYGPLGVEHRALMEFTSRVRWYTPVEVLRQATSGNAKLLSLSGKLNSYQEGKLGVIEAGAYADLLIYDGNPLEDVEVIVDYQQHLKFIMKDGVVYKNEL